MSLDESTLDDFTQQDPEPAVEYGDTERRCQNCHTKITEQYARVFGDNQNTVHECPHCPPEDSTEGDRADGAAAGLNPERRGVSTRRNP